MSVDDISQLLRVWSDGDQLALGELTPVVYAELRRLAHRYMRGERSNHSLQTTALVNEAYMRLVDYKRMQWQNRAHFFAVSARLMRRILVEHARRHNLKRGRGVQHVSLDEAVLVGEEPGADLVALDDGVGGRCAFHNAATVIDALVAVSSLRAPPGLDSGSRFPGDGSGNAVIRIQPCLPGLASTLSCFF
jgi:RNA polymerase sigma factor (TIGR02999 family)